MKKKPLDPYMTKLIPPRLHLPFTSSLPSSIPRHRWPHKLLCLSSLLQIQLMQPFLALIFTPPIRPSTTPPPPPFSLATLQLFYGIPCIIANSPWTPPSLISQENIMMPVNRLATSRIRALLVLFWYLCVRTYV